MFRILIIEDNSKLRKRIKRILISKFPFLRVAEASNEEETFLEIEKNQPDLVIMDIRLAGKNGLELTKKIKARYPHILIAINTNNDSPEYKSAAIQVGANFFLSKNSDTINDLMSLAQSISLKCSEDTVQTCNCD
ncbi:MAG: response regulator transcription factor [Desulfobacteraceae bacterium]|jgi:DNA-binding NarL/FixJ family response regulator|nr:response regulator transcription factor [Desulfobacteraceae bacterium]